MSRPRKAAPPPLPSDVDRLLAWNRARPVPDRFLDHDDPDVRSLAEATRRVNRAFWAWAAADCGPDMDAAEVALAATRAHLAEERHRFADVRGLPWSDPRPETRRTG